MKYVIDKTERGKTFSKLDVQRVHLLQFFPPAIGSEDVVFAHKTDFELGPTGDDDSLINQFRRLLVNQRTNSPLLIVYSGGNDFSTTTAQKDWRDQCVTVALPGFPADRVKFIDFPTSQNITRNDLRKVVETYMASGCSPNTPNHHQDALRILCEAWIMNDGAATQCHNGITICAPVVPENWFTPFGKAATAQAAEEISSQLAPPDLSAEVMVFFLDVLEKRLVPRDGVHRLAAKLGVPV